MSRSGSLGARNSCPKRGTADTVPHMGHHQGIEYTEHADDFGDVTGSEHAAAKDPDWIIGVVREAKLREKAAVAASETVRVQAARALMGRGMSIREAARYMDLPKSTVARHARGGPSRYAPQTDIDRLVQELWAKGLETKRESLAPRKGDKPRGYTIYLNLYSSDGPS